MCKTNTLEAYFDTEYNKFRTQKYQLFKSIILKLVFALQSSEYSHANQPLGHQEQSHQHTIVLNYNLSVPQKHQTTKST